MENNLNKAAFIERVFAYIIDIIVVTVLVSMISYPFTNNSDLEKIEYDMNEVVEKLSTNEITIDTYIDEMIPLSYESAKYQGVSILIKIFAFIMYFVVFQFYNKGQTIGKKLLKIKVISNHNDLTMNQLIIRSLLINSILFSMIQVIIISFASDANTYFYIVGAFESIQSLFVVASALMIMFSKEKKGLHDYIAKTEVVKI